MCLLKNDPTTYFVLQSKHHGCVGTAKASLNRANYMQYGIDPKPDELALGRLKFREIEMEDRTGELFNTLG